MKAVITAGGAGTRLLPATLETPKEMLPLFSKDINGNKCVKPLLQIVFEHLYNVGIRDFCFIVGRGKRSAQDHFTPDDELLRYLKKNGKLDLVGNLENFYSMRENVNIHWIDQLRPRGFGDAVLRASSFIASEPFLVYAGDTYIISPKDNYLNRLIKTFNDHNADASLLVEEVKDPRHYGIIEGDEIANGRYRVKRIVEKPTRPRTNLAATAIYIFDSIIFKALKKIKPDDSGEIQLTNAIQKLIDWDDKSVYAEKLRKNEFRLDIGKPDTYKDALDKSYELI